MTNFWRDYLSFMYNYSTLEFFIIAWMLINEDFVFFPVRICKIFVKNTLKKAPCCRKLPLCLWCLQACKHTRECMCFLPVLQTDKSSEPQTLSPLPLLRSLFPFGVKLHKLEASGCQQQQSLKAANCLCVAFVLPWRWWPVVVRHVWTNEMICVCFRVWSSEILHMSVWEQLKKLREQIYRSQQLMQRV